MTHEFKYNGTFQSYAEFTHFVSKYYPERKMPLVTFDRATKMMYIKGEDEEFSLSPGGVLRVTTKVEVLTKDQIEQLV